MTNLAIWRHNVRDFRDKFPDLAFDNAQVLLCWLEDEPAKANTDIQSYLRLDEYWTAEPGSSNLAARIDRGAALGITRVSREPNGQYWLMSEALARAAQRPDLLMEELRSKRARAEELDRIIRDLPKLASSLLRMVPPEAIERLRIPGEVFTSEFWFPHFLRQVLADSLATTIESCPDFVPPNCRWGKDAGRIQVLSQPFLAIFDFFDVLINRTGTSSEGVVANSATGDGGPLTPHWDNDLGMLLYEGNVILTCVPRAKNLRAVLNSFEELGWPTHIDDPVPGGTDAERVRSTAMSLREKQRPLRINFAADGSGKGFKWSRIDVPEHHHGTITERR